MNNVSWSQTGALIVNPEHTHLTNLLFLWLNLNMYLPGGLNTKSCSNITKKEIGFFSWLCTSFCPYSDN